MVARPPDCPFADFDQLRTIWTNHSTSWANQTQFDQFLCHLAEYTSIKYACHTAEAYSVLILGALGFLGALASICVFSWRPFRKLDFALYRLIGVFELGHTSIMAIVRQIQLIDRCKRDYACVFFRAHIHLAITNTCAETVDAVVLFLTVERIVACLLPNQFVRVHTARIYDLVVVISLTTAAFFNVIQAFEVEVIGDRSRSGGGIGGHPRVYTHVASPFADSPFYSFVSKVNLLRTCFLGSALALATGLSVLGLVKTELRKRQLLRLQEQQQSGGGSGTNRVKLNHKNLKRTIDLCCLQLCSAIPILINHIVYAMTLREGPTTTVVSKLADDAFRTADGFAGGLGAVNRARHRQYLRLATNMSNMMAHSAHFYLYLLFCGKIRAAVVELVKATREKCRRLFDKNHRRSENNNSTRNTEVAAGSPSGSAMCTSF